MRKIFTISVVLLLLSACEKDYDSVLVTYRASNGSSATTLSYRNDEGKLMMEEVEFESAEDVWKQTHEFRKGDIIYCSAVYYDSIASIKLEILIDGKVYKSNGSVNEPEKYIIVSGSIPY